MAKPPALASPPQPLFLLATSHPAAIPRWLGCPWSLQSSLESGPHSAADPASLRVPRGPSGSLGVLFPQWPQVGGAGLPAPLRETRQCPPGSARGPQRPTHAHVCTPGTSTQVRHTGHLPLSLGGAVHGCCVEGPSDQGSGKSPLRCFGASFTSPEIRVHLNDLPHWQLVGVVTR